MPFPHSASTSNNIAYCITLGSNYRVRSLASQKCTTSVTLMNRPTQPRVEQVRKSESLNMCNAFHTREHEDKGRHGFSLIELVVVGAIGMIVSAMTIPLVINSVRQYRLRTAGTDYANLLQQARTRAVRDDRFYTVLTDATNNRAYIDIPGSGTGYVSGDPMIALPTSIVPKAYSTGPAVSNLISQFLPANSSGTVRTTAVGPSFGPRGLPCTPSGGTCLILDGAGLPSSFITFFQNSQDLRWEAITVTPAGRIRAWSYNSSTWSPLN
jgi:Tfp pilus assembly protein FimT